MSWIETVDESKGEGLLKEIYEGCVLNKSNLSLRRK
jgi:hypothetical protein